MAKDDGKKLVRTIVVERCPHCQSGKGYTKTRGAHMVHESQALGTITKWFYVQCRECSGPYLLREVWPI